MVLKNVRKSIEGLIVLSVLALILIGSAKVIIWLDQIGFIAWLKDLGIF